MMKQNVNKQKEKETDRQRLRKRDFFQYTIENKIVIALKISQSQMNL